LQRLREIWSWQITSPQATPILFYPNSATTLHILCGFAFSNYYIKIQHKNIAKVLEQHFRNNKCLLSMHFPKNAKKGLRAFKKGKRVHLMCTLKLYSV
jgi:hypothetical protein